MSSVIKTGSKKTSFAKSFGSLFFSVGFVLIFRWILFEPFVIPSGSMIPSLLINDHIVVAKYTFGIRLPFSSKWLRPPTLPKRGDVVVFRSLDKDDFYLVKRVVGLPGDTVQFNDKGELHINGVMVERQPLASEQLADSQSWNAADLGDSPDTFDIASETLGEHKYFTLLEKNALHYSEGGRTIAPGMIYFMGDNRDRSRDSRFWGEVPVENLLGRATHVWLSCEQTLSEINFICDPRYIRWQRFFHRIQ